MGALIKDIRDDFSIKTEADVRKRIIDFVCFYYNRILRYKDKKFMNSILTEVNEYINTNFQGFDENKLEKLAYFLVLVDMFYAKGKTKTMYLECCNYESQKDHLNYGNYIGIYSVYYKTLFDLIGSYYLNYVFKKKNKPEFYDFYTTTVNTFTRYFNENTIFDGDINVALFDYNHHKYNDYKYNDSFYRRYDEYFKPHEIDQKFCIKIFWGKTNNSDSYSKWMDYIQDINPENTKKFKSPHHIDSKDACVVFGFDDEIPDEYRSVLDFIPIEGMLFDIFNEIKNDTLNCKVKTESGQCDYFMDAFNKFIGNINPYYYTMDSILYFKKSSANSFKAINDDFKQTVSLFNKPINNLPLMNTSSVLYFKQTFNEYINDINLEDYKDNKELYCTINNILKFTYMIYGKDNKLLLQNDLTAKNGRCVICIIEDFINYIFYDLYTLKNGKEFISERRFDCIINEFFRMGKTLWYDEDINFAPVVYSFYEPSQNDSFLKALDKIEERYRDLKLDVFAIVVDDFIDKRIDVEKNIWVKPLISYIQDVLQSPSDYPKTIEFLDKVVGNLRFE